MVSRHVMRSRAKRQQLMFRVARVHASKCRKRRLRRSYLARNCKPRSKYHEQSWWKMLQNPHIHDPTTREILSSNVQAPLSNLYASSWHCTWNEVVRRVLQKSPEWIEGSCRFTKEVDHLTIVGTGLECMKRLPEFSFVTFVKNSQRPCFMSTWSRPHIQTRWRRSLLCTSYLVFQVQLVA